MEIKFDKRNYRIHNERNKKLIKKSLEECGAGRSIVIDNDGEIIGGNGIYEAWGNKPVKVIETDGSELVVVKRTDLSTDDEKRKKLAVMDNTASDTADMNTDMILADFGSEEASEMGIDVPEIYEEPVDVDTNIEIEKKKIKIVFSYTDSHEIIDTFIREMQERHPELIYQVEIND